MLCRHLVHGIRCTRQLSAIRGFSGAQLCAGSGNSSLFRLQIRKASSLGPHKSLISISALDGSKRSFSFRSRQNDTVKVDPKSFDKESVHYTGKLFGLEADNFIFYAKVGGGILTIVLIAHLFLKGYIIMSRFSLQNVARLGFMGGFVTCLIGYTTFLTILRRRSINANAVYNQSIALVMRHEKVVKLLGSHPKTGEFKAYASSGGFKLPLLRRIRSGSYELSDLFGLKQRRLQMLFVLKNGSNGYEGLVACDVRKEAVGFFSSVDVYKSLSITLSDPEKIQAPETVVLVGRPEDVVYFSMLH